MLLPPRCFREHWSTNSGSNTLAMWTDTTYRCSFELCRKRKKAPTARLLFMRLRQKEKVSRTRKRIITHITQPAHLIRRPGCPTNQPKRHHRHTQKFSAALCVS